MAGRYEEPTGERIHRDHRGGNTFLDFWWNGSTKVNVWFDGECVDAFMVYGGRRGADAGVREYLANEELPEV